MALAFHAVTFEVTDVPATAAFWAALLDRIAVPDSGGILVPGSDGEVGLRFEPAAAPRTGSVSTRNRLHLHLTSTSTDDQQATVRRALDLGAGRLDVGQLPDEQHIVLADPDGNEFCVIEPGNPFLEGCGFLAEVTCEGTREVGQFWRDALGWQLVWDRGPQTAIQAPGGGTKLSWDEWEDTPLPDRPPQRFVLTSDDRAAEAERLIALGATLIDNSAIDNSADDTDSDSESDGAGIELADPDGQAFTLR